MTEDVKSYSFFHRDTGLFNGTILNTNSPELVSVHTPKDHMPLEGAHDGRLHRVNVVTGELESHTIEMPPDPNSRHALVSIERLERQAHRSLRELALDSSNIAARQRLEQIEAAIAELRQYLTG